MGPSAGLEAAARVACSGAGWQFWIADVVAGIATTNTHWGAWARPIALLVDLVGATAVAREKIMHNEPRWRLYRSSYEDLAAEGWAFFNSADDTLTSTTLSVSKSFSTRPERFSPLAASVTSWRSPLLTNVGPIRDLRGQNVQDRRSQGDLAGSAIAIFGGISPVRREGRCCTIRNSGNFLITGG